MSIYNSSNSNNSNSNNNSYYNNNNNNNESLNLSQSFSDSIFKDKINPNSSLFKSLSKSNNLNNSLINSSIEEFSNFYKKNNSLIQLEDDIEYFLENKNKEYQTLETKEELKDVINITISFLNDSYNSIKIQRSYIQKLEDKIKLDTKFENDFIKQSNELNQCVNDYKELKIKFNNLESNKQSLSNKIEELKLIIENNEIDNQRKIANKNIEIEEYIKKIKFLSNKENELEGKVKSLEDKYSELDRNTQLKIRAIEKEKMQCRTEVTELKHKSPTNNPNNNELKAKDSEIKHLKTVNKQLDNQIQQQKKSLEETLKLLSEKENQLDQLQINSISKSSPIKSTSSESTSSESIEQKLKDNQVIIQSLKSELQYYKQQNQDNINEVERLKTISNNLGNLELIKQQNDSYKDKISRLEPIIEKYNSLQIEYSNLLQEKLNMESSVDSNKNESNEQLLQKIIKLENDNQLLVSKIGDLTANWKLVENRYKDINENIQSEKESIENKEKRINELTEKIKRVEKLNYLLKRERDNFKNILDAYDEQDDQQPNGNESNENILKLKNERIKELERALKEKSLLIEEFGLLNDNGSTDGIPKVINQEKVIQQYKDDIVKLNKEIESLLQENAMLESRLGKGEYDPTKTKVLHLTNNPTSAILQQFDNANNNGTIDGSDKKLLEENHRLQIQINDGEKKLDRLKLIFRQKINEFREGVYALLGYKIEVDTNGLYKLQSMYAESEGDFLLFKNNTSNKTIQMELLETDFTRNLDKEIKAYLFTCKSIPSFLSQVTIDLFSRQTFHP